MKKIAIITARGGSKRIPRKNIRDFLGRPIIAYTIEAALASELFDEVMVSTDDNEIAEIGQRYGASVPFRRSIKNADDYATTADVLEEVLLEYQTRNQYFSLGCCLYPTAPFVTAEKLQTAYALMITQSLDAVFPVVRYAAPIQRALRRDDSGCISMFYPEYARTRSQDLEPAYYDAGQFYWFRTEMLLRDHQIMSGQSGVIVNSEMEVHDIDTEEDWSMAEHKYQRLYGK